MRSSTDTSSDLGARQIDRCRDDIEPPGCLVGSDGTVQSCGPSSNQKIIAGHFRGAAECNAQPGSEALPLRIEVDQQRPAIRFAAMAVAMFDGSGGRCPRRPL